MHIPPRNSKEKARDYAIRVLRENIVSLTLEPGWKVSETELAAQMGLSRTPIREALLELSNYGIIDIFPQHTSMIAKIDPVRIDEAQFMRLALETAAAQMACDVATEEQLDELHEMVQIQKVYLANGNSIMLLKMDNAFHRAVFAICNKLTSYGLMQNMAVHFDRLRRLTVTTIKNLKVVEDHEAILAALRARDKAGAERCMTVHLTRYKQDQTIIHENYRHLFR